MKVNLVWVRWPVDFDGAISRQFHNTGSSMPPWPNILIDILIMVISKDRARCERS